MFCQTRVYFTANQLIYKGYFKTNIMNIKNYRPNETPVIIPKGYRVCEELGNEGKIDISGRVISCTADCPYNHQSENAISWEEETQKRYICETKGLVKKNRIKS